MQIVISTQYRENYGAHDWSGEGECPQYWKNKGGSTFVVKGMTQAEAEDFLASKIQEIAECIEYRSNFAEEYIIDQSIVEDTAMICESWESPNVISFENGKWIVSQVMINDEYGYLNQKIAEKHTSYELKKGGKSENAQVKFVLKTGETVNYEELVNFI